VALTQEQIDAFEQQRLSIWDRILGQSPSLLTGEQYVLLALQTISDQLAQIAGGGSAGSSGAVAPVGSPVATTLAVTFSLNPRQLNEILIGTPAIAGYIAGSANQFAVLVPAGGNASVQIPPPPGYVTSTVGTVNITTTDVAAGIQASVSLDGHPLIGPQGFVFGPSSSLRSSQYNYAKSTGVEMTLTNPSSSDVTVYVEAELLSISLDFYNRFIAPLENAAYAQIQAAFGLSGPEV